MAYERQYFVRPIGTGVLRVDYSIMENTLGNLSHGILTKQKLVDHPMDLDHMN